MRVRGVVVLLLVVMGGCLWRGYSRVLEIHLEVLGSMAVKMCGLTAGPPPASESMGEFVYPGKRARELEQQFSSRAERPSYQGFSQVVQRYEALVQRFDRSRANQESWEVSAAQVCEESRAIAEQVRSVRQSLAQEG